MVHFLIILAMLGVACSSYVQNHEMDKLDAAVVTLDDRYVLLKSKLEQKRDLVAALYRYTASNHKNIRRLKRKRVLDVEVFGPRQKVAHGPERPLSRSVVAVPQDLDDVGWTPGRKVYIKGKGIFSIAAVLPEGYTQKLHLYTPSGAAASRLGGEGLEVFLLDMESPIRQVALVD